MDDFPHYILEGKLLIMNDSFCFGVAEFLIAINWL